MDSVSSFYNFERVTIECVLLTLLLVKKGLNDREKSGAIRKTIDRQSEMTFQ